MGTIPHKIYAADFGRRQWPAGAVKEAEPSGWRRDSGLWRVKESDGGGHCVAGLLCLKSPASYFASL